MRRSRRDLTPRLVRVLAGVLIGVMPATVGAQLIQVTPGGGEFGVEGRSVRSAIIGDGRAWDTFLSTWVSFPVSGSVLTPRLLTYHASFRPTRSQQTIRGRESPQESNSLGLSVGASLLPAAVISVSVHADRTTTASPNDQFGASSTYRNGSAGGLARFRLPAFPLRFEWNTLDLADSWNPAFTQAPIRRDESLHVLRLTGESSKLTTSLERQRFVDRIGVLDFASDAGTAQHSLRWGTGSSLTSSLEVYRREGRDPQQRRLILEHVHLRHSPSVMSDLTVHRQRFQSGGDYVSDVATTLLAVQADPREWLSANVSGSYMTNDYTNGQVRMLSTTPTISVRRMLPGALRFVSSVGASYQRTDQRLSQAIPIPVSDELHVVDATRRLQLRHERVDALTVTVYNRDRTVSYLEGIDYRVLTLGDLVLIEIPIASRILEGDQLLIGYAYAAPTARAYDLRGGSAALAVSRGGVSLSQSAVLRRAHTLAGDDAQGLEGGDDFVSALDVRRAVGDGQATLNAQHRARRRARSDFTSSELRLGFSPAGGTDRQTTFGASVARTGAAAQVATVWGSSASLLWMIRSGLHLNAAAETQVWQLRDRGADRTNVFRLDLRWRVARLETDWQYRWQQRNTFAQRSEHRFSARAVRRF